VTLVRFIRWESTLAVVLLATGAQRHRDLELPGRELGGVALAMDYLTDRNRELAGLPRRGAVTAAGRHVVILGGGDTSADCLGNALREGALSVTEVAHGPMPPASRPSSVRSAAGTTARPGTTSSRRPSPATVPTSSCRPAS